IGRQLGEALEAAYARLGRVDTEIEAIRANRDLSVEAKHRRIAETRAAAQSEAKETIGKLRDRVDRAIERGRAKLDETAREYTGRAWTHEINDYIRSLPNSVERMQFIAAEAERGNREVVAVALGNPHRFLVGLDDVPEAAFQEFRQSVLGALDRERAGVIDTLVQAQRTIRDAIAGCDWDDLVTPSGLVLRTDSAA